MTLRLDVFPRNSTLLVFQNLFLILHEIFENLTGTEHRPNGCLSLVYILPLQKSKAGSGDWEEVDTNEM